MKYLIITIIITFTISVNSQTLFSKIYPSAENFRTSRVKEDLEGNYIVGGYRDVISENRCRPFVIKINSAGTIIDSAFYFTGKTNDWMIQDVLIDSLNYYFLGFGKIFQSSYLAPSDSSLFILKTDYSLNPLDTFFFEVVGNYLIRYATCKFDKHENIIINGYSYNGSKFSSFIFKTNKLFDYWNVNSLPFSEDRLFSNLMIIDDYYYSHGYSFSVAPSGELYKYDTNLVLLQTFQISVAARQYYSSIVIDDNSYFTSGFKYTNTIPPQKVFAVIKTKINSELIDSLEFGNGDSTNYPALYDAMSILNNNLYYTGSIYSPMSLPLFGATTPSNLLLIKMDTNLNIIWQKLIGGDAYYTAMNVIATSDNGILIMASRDDLTDNLNNLSVVLIKVDENGSVVWSKDVFKEITKLKLFPNPATTHITIDWQQSNEESVSLQIFSSTGRLVQSFGQVKAGQELSVEQLSPGIYLLEGLTAKGQRFVGKFVKE